MDKETDLSIKNVVSDSYRFFVSNSKSIAILSLPMLSISRTVHLLTENGEGLFLLVSAAVDLLVYPIITAALILFLEKRSLRQRVDYREILSEALVLWWPVFLVLLVSGAAALLGFFLLIVPGIWIIVKLSFAPFFTVLVRVDPYVSLKQSFVTTTDSFWTLLLSIAIFTVPIFAIESLLEAAFSPLAFAKILNFALSMAAGFCYLIWDVVVFRIFMLTVLESKKNGETA